jgi:hypothetical protein
MTPALLFARDPIIYWGNVRPVPVECFQAHCAGE